MGNTIKVSNILYPEKFQTNFIVVYSSFNDELKILIEESGYKNEFTRKYFKSLKFLDSLRENCFVQGKLFENLKESNGLWSIMLHGEKNIRILFAFISNEYRSFAVLLYAFQEKDKKNNSRTGYDNAKEVASRRLHDIENV